MEESANFIPLGGNDGVPRDASRLSRGSTRAPKVIGETPEDRKRIAREVRLAARKEKKKGKQEAKAARKANGILHRRMHRNDEKYVKNKDRNAARAIDMERRQIQDGAVRQAEQLAAIHDLSGKKFNVGEMVVMPDGQIKSKERLRENEEGKQRRAQETADYEAKVKQANDGFREARARLEEDCAANGTEVTVLQIQKLRARYPVPARISKKQMAKRETLAPRPPPRKPVIPEGYSIPEDEEDLLALWDITDEEISKRISHRKKEKSLAAKSLRKVQKEKKKFNRAMKVLKKQCAAAGVIFDPEKAKKEVLGMMSDASGSDSDAEDDDSASASDSDSDSDSSSGSDSDDESDESTSASEDKKKAKKSKKTNSGDREAKDKSTTALKLKGSRPKIDLALLAKADAFEEALKQKKREKKEKRKQERKEKAAKEAAEQAKLEEERKALEKAEKKAKKSQKAAAIASVSADDSSSNKRKRSRDDDEDDEASRKAEKKAKKAALKAEKTPVKIETEDVVVAAKPEKPISSKRKRVEEPVEDEEDKASREKSERKKAKKAAKALVLNPEPAPEEDEAKAKRERKEARKAEKAAKSKPAESNDDRLDKAIAEREARIKGEAKPKYEAPSVDQWNPEALGGDDARKSKFMRLLGAGKGKPAGEPSIKRASGEKDTKKTVEQIYKVQSELERQYESGMKMKHDGGSKRRGLGA